MTLIEDYDYHISVGISNGDSQTWDTNLQYDMGQWGCRDDGHGVTLSLIPIRHEGKLMGDALLAPAAK